MSNNEIIDNNQLESAQEDAEKLIHKSEEKWKDRFLEGWIIYKRNKGALIGTYVVALVLIMAIFANIIAPHSPIEQSYDHILSPPVWQDGGNWQFILGTDSVGRDILSRLIHGSRYSLYVGLIIILLSSFTGITLGLTAGFFGGFVELMIIRAMDIIQAFPSLLLALVVVAILGPSLENSMLAIALVLIPGFVRITRAQVLSEKSKDYVAASRILGSSNLRIMFISILPNCMPPLIVQSTLNFSSAVLETAALGFLGMGAQPPAPEWGTMLAEAREFILSAWWVVTFPGLSILITVLSINLIGDGLRDVLDPKSKR